MAQCKSAFLSVHPAEEERGPSLGTPLIWNDLSGAGIDAAGWPPSTGGNAGPPCLRRVITRLHAWVQERRVLRKRRWLRLVLRTLGKRDLQTEPAISQFAPPLACLPPRRLPGGRAADSLGQRVWQQAPAPCVPRHAGAACRGMCAGCGGCRASQPHRRCRELPAPRRQRRHVCIHSARRRLLQQPDTRLPQQMRSAAIFLIFF